MVQMNRMNVRSVIASAVGAVVSMLSLSGSVFAALPLETLVNSTAGRMILAEGKSGSAAVARVTGVSVEASLRQGKLLEALADPRMAAAAEDISTRLNRIEARFREKFPGSADEIFGQSSRALNAAEKACLMRLAGEELDPAFVEFLPTRPAGAPKTYAAWREAFLTEQILRKAPETAVEKLARWKATSFGDRALNVRVYDMYQQIVAFDQVKAVLSPLAVQELLAESASAPLIRNLEKVMNTDVGTVSMASIRSNIIEALKIQLNGKVPAASIKGRIDSLLKDPSSLKALKRALGELTLAETQLMYHGGNPLAPTAESWLGQYINKTGAATVVRQFEKVPGRPELSEPRLVVSVDANTITQWSSLFGNEHFFGQLHTPRQGTLMVTFNNSTASWSGANPANVMRAASEGTFIPAMILSSTEGGRMERYFTYGKDWTSFQRIRNPWENAEYCARGAYGSCTHWFGNIPIGDRLVTEYKLPGWVDHDPYTPVSERGAQDPSPRIETLNPYANAEADEGLREVLRYPGHQQLSEVMGLVPQQLAAELTNPGWVAVSVLGNAPVSRVPVVFRFVSDARAPVAPDFDLQIDAH